MSVKDGSLVINIHGTPVTAFVSLWPTAKITALFAGQGYTDELPSYDEICDDITAGTNYDGSLYVLIEADNKDQIKSDYMALLRAANFTYDSASSNEYDDVFKSPNNQYTVAVSTNRFGVSLTIKKIEGGQQGGDGFPMAQIVADLPIAEGILPALEAEGATFAYDFYFGEAFVTVTLPTQAAAEAARDAYIEVLTSSGFTFTKLWGYLDAYLHSNGVLAVEIDETEITNGVIKLGILEYETY